MSSTTSSSASFQSIFDVALDSYSKQTGIDLTKHPSADKLQNCRSSDDVLQILSERESAFKDYRDQHRNLIDCLRPVVQVVHAFSAVLGEAAGLVRWHSPYRVVYLIVSLRLPTGAVQTNKSDICRRRCSPLGIYLSPMGLSTTSLCDPHLRQAATGVSASYDALADLFECVANFLKRFHIYTKKISLSATMSDIMVKIMAEVLAVLALATKQIKQGRFSKWPAVVRHSLVERDAEKFAKKLLGESEVEAVLQRLDRLTQEEARMTVAHTLEVVHGLFNNLRVVMDGA